MTIQPRSRANDTAKRPDFPALPELTLDGPAFATKSNLFLTPVDTQSSKNNGPFAYEPMSPNKHVASGKGPLPEASCKTPASLTSMIFLRPTGAAAKASPPAIPDLQNLQLSCDFEISQPWAAPLCRPSLRPRPRADAVRRDIVSQSLFLIQDEDEEEEEVAAITSEASTANLPRMPDGDSLDAGASRILQPRCSRRSYPFATN